MNIFSVVFSGKSEEGLRNGVEVVKCYLWVGWVFLFCLLVFNNNVIVNCLKI